MRERGHRRKYNLAPLPDSNSCVLQGDHYGPINIYMAKVDDATSAVGSDADWFKVDEMGLPSSNPDYWATGELSRQSYAL